MVSDQSYETNLKKAAFIVNEYPILFNKNDIKSLIKYSFFKNFK